MIPSIEEDHERNGFNIVVSKSSLLNVFSMRHQLDIQVRVLRSQIDIQV